MVRLLVCLLMIGTAFGQEQEPAPKKYVPKVVPVPRPKAPMMEKEPDPSLAAVKAYPAQTVLAAGIELRVPAGWRVSRTDGEMSTFGMDARSAAANAQLRMMGMLGYNPFPRSTFSGAMFYLSTAKVSAEECARQTARKPDIAIGGATIDDVAFKRGKDEHGRICTQARDIAYTTMRGRVCLRFDLAVNTFCGGDVSGVTEMSDKELADVFGRMEGILTTVKFLGK